MKIDVRPIVLVIGMLLAILGISMMVPAVVDLAVGNPDWKVFVASGLITSFIGLSFFGAARGTTKALSTHQAFVMTIIVWLSLAVFGALPYLWSGIVPHYGDAFFESMSALTTTGATVITGLDTAPPGILLWRGIQQWLGGLGIIVMAVAILPMLQVGGMQLFKIEAFDTAEKIMPRATQISGSLTLAFIFITLACAVAYLLAGMTTMDAVVHAMTTVATGGMSTRDSSIGHYNSDIIDLIAVTFMILGSLPFILYVHAVKGNMGRLFTDSQVRVFLSLLSLLVFGAWFMHPGHGVEERTFVHAMFNVTSIMTGTGYATTDFSAWGHGANMFFFGVMFLGGCAGSTSCGIKIFRFQVLFEAMRQHMREIFYPNGVFHMRFNNKTLDESVVAAVLNFLFLYIATFAVSSVLLGLTGLDFITSISAAGSAISNVGPGLGELIGPASTYKDINIEAKWLLSMIMLVGRLELFTVLVLLVPRFWRG